MNAPSNAELLDALEALARRAGDRVMTRYHAADTAVRRKDDDSPVTDADLEAEAVILEGLAGIDPATPVISEECACAGVAPAIGRRYWLVDPLDGTREFVLRNGEFTVNIALIEDGRPTLGVLHAPAFDRLYVGLVGRTAQVIDRGHRRTIMCRAVPPEGPIVLDSRSHRDSAQLEEWLLRRQVAGVERCGSSLKFGRIAAGEADLYPRFGRTMEWDTAAGHAILEAAGGGVHTLEGVPLRYGKPGFENPGFLAWGSVAPSPSQGRSTGR